MADDSKSPQGALEHSVRTAAIWDSVVAALSQREQQMGRPLRVVDLGGGAGGLAVPVAALGHHVTVVDPSPNALASLAQWASEQGVQERISSMQGDSDSLADVVEPGQADFVSCHGTLEHIDDPRAAIIALAGVLAEGGVLSLVVAQRLGTVVSRALAGRFDEAKRSLLSDDGRWGDGDPLQRRFDAAHIAELLAGAGLEIVDAEGVRLFGDLVPASMLDSEHDRMALLDLERTIAAHPSSTHLAHIGAALHVLARRVGTDEGE